MYYKVVTHLFGIGISKSTTCWEGNFDLLVMAQNIWVQNSQSAFMSNFG